MSTRQVPGPSLLILTVGQVEAAYSAMCALNNVGAFMNATLIPNGPGHFIGICQESDGRIEIMGKASSEFYASQHEFAVAYGLNPAMKRASAEASADTTRKA